MISMNLELINPYVLRILISVRNKDSINAISKRINLSYGWTHNWIKKLVNLNVLELTRMNVWLNGDNEFYRRTLKYIKEVLSNNVSFYYNALSLFGIKYCFTNTDGVFIWTKGGYNISRYKNYYPIFIKVKKENKNLFEDYCKKLGLRINKNNKIFYMVNYLDDFEVSYCDNIPVDSLNDTIKFMLKNKYNFEPALEMINEMYGKKLKVKYKEVMTNV